jgi:hypothetical protein
MENVIEKGKADPLQGIIDATLAREAIFGSPLVAC